MNIDMRIRHGDPSRGKGCLQAVEDVIAAGPVILRARPEAQDVIDRAVAVAGDVGFDGPAFEDLLMRGRGCVSTARTVSAASSYEAETFRSIRRAARRSG